MARLRGAGLDDARRNQSAMNAQLTRSCAVRRTQADADAFERLLRRMDDS